MRHLATTFASITGLVALSTAACAGCIAPGPAPLLGALGGPWGLAAAAVCYGGYRLYKRKA